MADPRLSTATTPRPRRRVALAARLLSGACVVMALLVATLAVQAEPAAAHHAEVSDATAVTCVDGELMVSWSATSWNFDSSAGLHPLVHVDLRTDVAEWAVIGSGAFTDGNGRTFSGMERLDAQANWVEIRVRPDENEVWGSGTARGGARTMGLTISEDVRAQCEVTSPPAPEPTPTAEPTAEPTAVPTAEPTAVPTAEPTAVPTAEPTAVPTAEPTAVPTAEPTAVPTAEPTAVPTAEPTAVPTAEPTVEPTPTPDSEVSPSGADAIRGVVCFDGDGDGLRSATDDLLFDVLVRVWIDVDDEVGPDRLIDETRTVSGGVYAFASLAAGDGYYVQFVAPDGYTYTLADQGDDDTVDSDADATSGIAGPITVQPGITAGVDACLITVQPASIGDRVWFDSDRNGIQDEGEVGVAGVTVNLWVDDDRDGAPDRILETMVTGAQGEYRFVELDPSLVYVVQFADLPVGTVLTTTGAGDDRAVDSDADATTGITAAITLEPGDEIITVDAGVTTPPCTLGGLVWLDRDADGLQNESGASSVAGVRVNLWIDLDDDGTPDEQVSSQVSDANGRYTFESLECDQAYIIEFVTPDGSTFTSVDVGDDDTIDSDADPITGLTDVILLEPGESDLTNDAGLEGQMAAIRVEKATNARDADTVADADVIAEGASVTWTYVVTNTGTFDLVDVVVFDDLEGPVCTIDSLAVGEAATCELEGKAIDGVYRNVASTTGDPVDLDGQPALDIDGQPVPSPTDDDPSHYVGVAAEVLGVEIVCTDDGIGVKLDNDGDAPILLQVFSDGQKVGDYTVQPGIDRTARVVLAEDARTVIDVFSGDLKVGTAAVQRNCDPDTSNPTPSLPRTGASPRNLLILATGLVVLGGLFLMGGRELELARVEDQN